MRCGVALALILAACGPAEDNFQRSAPFKPGVLKIHLAQDTSAVGLQKVVAGSGEVIYLHPNPELTEAHLEKVTVWNGDHEDKIVALRFNDDGTARMSRLTAANVGKRLAFVIGEKIVTAPMIRSQVDEGEALIEGGFSKQEAEDLARVLSGS